MLRPIFLAVLALTVLACDKRTPEEKGRDLASEKLDLAKGAADVLKAKGGDLGKTAGQGVGELVKGIGSGVKDVVSPPVTVELEASATESGVTVNRANERKNDSTARTVEVYTAFSKPFRGRLELRAFDESGAELGLGVSNQVLDVKEGARELVEFSFPTSVRFSHAKVYKLRSLAGAKFGVHEALAGIEFSQVTEKPSMVTAYFRFVNKFDGALELRAYDASGVELGRSNPSSKLQLAADSAQYLDFNFDPRTPLTNAARYEVRLAAHAN